MEQKAREQVLRLLTVRSRSRRELYLRLKQKGHPDSLIGPLLDRLTETGLIDDARFAAERARALGLSKGWGPRKLTADLRAKGVNADLVQAAIDEVYAETPQVEILRRVAEKKFGAALFEAEVEVDFKLKGRAQRFLLGRGFDGELVRDLLQGC
ncbi:MAG: regulatory protein RecX [Deltaproteobacteria bacterium]|nr:regulatory protein RecX [Deltaproteobacteria bacterium]